MGSKGFALAVYGITKVCMTKDKKHIKEVKAIENPMSNSIGYEKSFLREQIVAILDSRVRNKPPCVITLLPANSLEQLCGLVWKEGAAVIHYEIERDWFIKTKKNNDPNDNLENIPEYIDCHKSSILRFVEETRKIRSAR